MPCRYFGYDCSVCHPIEDCPRVKEKPVPTRVTEKRETRPENLKVGDKVTMVTSKIETRVGVVTEVDVKNRQFRLREEGQMDGLRWGFDHPTVNEKAISSRTFAVELEPWQDGDVAMNTNGGVRFLEGDSWVDAFGKWQANKGAKSTESYVAIVRAGKPVPRG